MRPAGGPALTENHVSRDPRRSGDFGPALDSHGLDPISQRQESFRSAFRSCP